jgi:hypothetical protein
MHPRHPKKATRDNQPKAAAGRSTKAQQSRRYFLQTTVIHVTDRMVPHPADVATKHFQCRPRDLAADCRKIECQVDDLYHRRCRSRITSYSTVTVKGLEQSSTLCVVSGFRGDLRFSSVVIFPRDKINISSARQQVDTTRWSRQIRIIERKYPEGACDLSRV